MIAQQFSIDHVGWITRSVDLFERFWCDILGFEPVFDSVLDRERSRLLFGVDTTGTIRRYQRGDMTIEIHHLEDIEEAPQVFNRFGLNHIALHVADREAFVRGLETSDEGARVRVHRHLNPGGWFNIFIQDFEGNWIELRESFKTNGEQNR